jgi:hypothetical protein
MNTNRPLTANAAIVLLTLMSVLGLITPVLAVVLPLKSGPPLVIQVSSVVVMGIGGLIAAVGLWSLKRWGLALASIVAALGVLTSLYSLWFLSPIPSAGMGASIVVGVVNALVLVLVALPATRRAYAAVRLPVAQA